jgi:hypothetical protein
LNSSAEGSCRFDAADEMALKAGLIKTLIFGQDQTLAFDLASQYLESNSEHFYWEVHIPLVAEQIFKSDLVDELGSALGLVAGDTIAKYEAEIRMPVSPKCVYPPADHEQGFTMQLPVFFPRYVDASVTNDNNWHLPLEMNLLDLEASYDATAEDFVVSVLPVDGLQMSEFHQMRVTDKGLFFECFESAYRWDC